MEAREGAKTTINVPNKYRAAEGSAHKNMNNEFHSCNASALEKLSNPRSVFDALGLPPRTTLILYRHRPMLPAALPKGTIASKILNMYAPTQFDKSLRIMPRARSFAAILLNIRSASIR
jgi:hypothetical protein